MFDKRKMYCTVCGTVDYPQRVKRGSILISFVLWICFLVPGIVYSLWRLTSRYDACYTCGSPNIVPLTSPVARTALAAMAANPPPPLVHEAGFRAWFWRMWEA